MLPRIFSTHDLGQKVLVTGGGGFLGFEICKQLKTHGFKSIYSLARSRYSKLEKLEIEQIQTDLTDQNDLNKTLSKYEFDVVIHCAAKAGVWGDFDEYNKINYVGTKNLAHFCLERVISNFIYTSTPSVVFGKDNLNGVNESCKYPSKYLTHYAKTKSLAERYLLSLGEENKLKLIAIRPHLIWGKGDPHILPRLLERASKNKLKVLGDGENQVDIIHVSNAAHAHLLALRKLLTQQEYSKVFFVGQNEPVKLWEFTRKLISHKYPNYKLKKVPLLVGYLTGACLEFLYKVLSLKGEPMMTRFVALQLGKSHYFSHQAVQKELGYFELVSTQQGIDQIHGRGL